MNQSVLARESLTISQIEDLRLAASKLKGPARRASSCRDDLEVW